MEIGEGREKKNKRREKRKERKGRRSREQEDVDEEYLFLQARRRDETGGRYPWPSSVVASADVIGRSHADYRACSEARVVRCSGCRRGFASGVLVRESPKLPRKGQSAKV